MASTETLNGDTGVYVLLAIRQDILHGNNNYHAVRVRLNLPAQTSGCPYITKL